MVAPVARAIAGGVPGIGGDRVGHCDGSSRVANIRSFEKFTLVGPRIGVLKVTDGEGAVRLRQRNRSPSKASATRIEFPLAKRARGGPPSGGRQIESRGKKKSHFPLPGS